MTRLKVISLAFLAGLVCGLAVPSHAAEQNTARFACESPIFQGNVPDITVKFNEVSHVLTLQRDGAEKYHAKQVEKGIWLEMGAEAGRDPENITFPSRGQMQIKQGGVVTWNCYEAN